MDSIEKIIPGAYNIAQSFGLIAICVFFIKRYINGMDQKVVALGTKMDGIHSELIKIQLAIVKNKEHTRSKVESLEDQQEDIDNNILFIDKKINENKKRIQRIECKEGLTVIE